MTINDKELAGLVLSLDYFVSLHSDNEIPMSIAVNANAMTDTPSREFKDD